MLLTNYTHATSNPPPSPLSCGCVLAMIHLTRQHFIRAFRENRGFCHFPESFTRPGAGSTPLASPSRLPSTTLPSTLGRGGWAKMWGDKKSSGQYGNQTILTGNLFFCTTINNHNNQPVFITAASLFNYWPPVLLHLPAQILTRTLNCSHDISLTTPVMSDNHSVPNHS